MRAGIWMRSGIWKRNGCLIRRQSVGTSGDFQIGYCVYRNGLLISRNYSLREGRKGRRCSVKWQQTSVNEWLSECGAYRLRGGHADGNYWRAYSGERLIAASCDRTFVEMRCESELAASMASANGYATTKASQRCETGT